MLVFDALTQLKVDKARLHLILIIMGYECWLEGLSNDLISIFWCKRAQQTSRSHPAVAGRSRMHSMKSRPHFLIWSGNAVELCYFYLTRIHKQKATKATKVSQGWIDWNLHFLRCLSI